MKEVRDSLVVRPHTAGRQTYFRLLCGITSIWILNLSGPLAAAQSFYVSANGSDTNAGTNVAAPFQTLARAQTAVQAINFFQSGDLTVYLSGGLYRLTNAITFTEADSGQHGHRVIWQAMPGQTPAIDGGILVTNWKLADGSKNIWEASVPAGVTFRQLYVNGIRGQMARTPDDFGLVETTNGYWSSDSRLRAMADSTSMSTLEVVVQPSAWGEDILPVADVAAAGTVTIQNPAWSIYQSWTNWGHPSVLYLQSAYEFLANSGDWYLNPAGGTVYYLPRSGDNMTNAVVEAPVLEQLFVLAGTSNNPVGNMRFEGLTFQNTTWRLIGPGWGLLQGQANQPEFTPTNWTVKAALDASGALNVDVNQCTFMHLGGNGVNVLKGSENVVIDHCLFHDLAATAIQVDEGWAANDFGATSAQINEDILVANNTIYDVGVDYPSACGIFLGYTRNCSVLHNQLFLLPYTGISIGWGWGVPVSYTSGNSIQGNCIHDYLQVLADGGGIYCLGMQQHATLADNYIFSANGGWGGDLYLDQGSINWSVFNNVVRQDSAPYWLFFTQYSTNYAYANFADSNQVYGASTEVDSNTIITNDDWPDAAQALINGAGPDFATYYTCDTNSLLIGRTRGNGCFVQGLTGWTVGGASAAIRAGVTNGIYPDSSTPVGTASVAFNAGGANPGGTLSTMFEAVAGRTYALAYSQATMGAANDQTLREDVIEPNENDIYLGASTTHAPELYSRYFYSFTATASGTATLQFTDATTVSNAIASDSVLTRVELRDVTAPGYTGPLGGQLLLSDSFNSSSTSAAGFNQTLATDQHGHLAPITYTVTTSGQEWQAQHGNGGTMLLVGDVGYGATASLDENFASSANAANAPLQIQFNGYVDSTTNQGCWFSFALGGAQGVYGYQAQADFGLLPTLGGLIQVWSDGMMIDVQDSPNQQFTVMLSDTNGTGSPFNGNGSKVKWYAGGNLLGSYQLSQINSGSGYLTFGANPWNGSYNVAHIDNLQFSLPAPALSEDWESVQAVVRWPANAVGFSLYRSMALGDSANWTPVTNPVPVLDAGRNQMKLVLVPGAAQRSFFRLQH